MQYDQPHTNIMQYNDQPQNNIIQYVSRWLPSLTLSPSAPLLCLTFLMGATLEEGVPAVFGNFAFSVSVFLCATLAIYLESFQGIVCSETKQGVKLN